MLNPHDLLVCLFFSILNSLIKNSGFDNAQINSTVIHVIVFEFVLLQWKKYSYMILVFIFLVVIST